MEAINIKNLANINRIKIIDMIYKAKAGHPGGSLSIIDILTAIYETDVDLSNKIRSRVILSKGHTVPAQYAILNSKGILKDYELETFRKINSRLQGHPHIVDIPEVDCSTGLLGQGLSLAIGMAIAKKNSNDSTRVYCIVGDGEMHEGQIWEAMLQAAHYKLNNLILIVDYNKLSSSGNVNDVINLDSLYEKIKSFNFNVKDINGHDMEQILKTLTEARNEKNRPTAIIANTIKGKGVSFMENNPTWHSKALSDEEYKIATNEIRAVM